MTLGDIVHNVASSATNVKNGGTPLRPPPRSFTPRQEFLGPHGPPPARRRRLADLTPIALHWACAAATGTAIRCKWSVNLEIHDWRAATTRNHDSRNHTMNQDKKQSVQIGGALQCRAYIIQVPPSHEESARGIRETKSQRGQTQEN